jgi:pimeloyl-ACP methyl ester carboxylesterase
MTTTSTEGFRFAAEEASFADAFSEKFAEIESDRIHFVEGGAGTPLLLVPGWPQTWLAWRKIMPALAKRYQVMAIDPPGMGDSDPPANGRYDTPNIASILNRFVQHLGHSKIVYIGHDVGVWIGYSYGALYGAEGLAYLALIDATIPGVSPVLANPWDPGAATRSWHFFFNQLDGLPEQLTTGRERVFLAWWFRSKGRRPDVITEREIEAYYREYSKPKRMTQAWAYYRAIPQTAETHRSLAEKPLPVPVLAIGGSHSAGRNLERALTASSPHTVGEVIDECGHFVPEEQPERTTSILLERLGAAGL